MKSDANLIALNDEKTTTTRVRLRHWDRRVWAGEKAQGDVEQTFPCRVECHLAETTTTTLDIDDEKRKKIHKIRKWKSLGEKILQFL